jgi:hypothetical protein
LLAIIDFKMLYPLLFKKRNGKACSALPNLLFSGYDVPLTQTLIYCKQRAAP